ncbi:competence protein ComEA [Pseudomonas frederiksbergensis]|jgi:competence protein ComEA|uniref:Competence protein ComEA n=1 Tax=Pseudomonas frederiksbergensis TaxID=104087 RepID=A0A423JF53_9PSED|nr:helix-hairpin-helix domain-containing protein [Pseudomonas frederiksbergensis]RON36326.1 competence protein ComEA [Pseudomonas frederiksbergensis]
MKTGYFYSLVFALLTSASIAVVAAPAAPVQKSEVAAVIPAPAQGNVVRVDLNSADAATLQRELAGIGEAKAKAIVAYRESNGPFSSADELLEVKGIGKAILDRNREKIEVN